MPGRWPDSKWQLFGRGTGGGLGQSSEVIVVHLAQDLLGPGSTIGSARNLPSHATRCNYHHAAVIDINTTGHEASCQPNNVT